MASDLLSIAKSGAQAARIALDVTAQNIANASSEGYVRRTVRLEEVSAAGGIGADRRRFTFGRAGRSGDPQRRPVPPGRSAPHRRRYRPRHAEVSGLQSVEAALEQTGVFNSIVEFEGALQQLAVDPTDPRCAPSVIETTRTMSRTFNIAASSLDTAGEGIASKRPTTSNRSTCFGAGTVARKPAPCPRRRRISDQTSLLDQRDSLLNSFPRRVDVNATFSPISPSRRAHRRLRRSAPRRWRHLRDHGHGDCRRRHDFLHARRQPGHATFRRAGRHGPGAGQAGGRAQRPAGRHRRRRHRPRSTAHRRKRRRRWTAVGRHRRC
jgi:hypothetical protein